MGKINYDYLKVFAEIPLLLKLHFNRHKPTTTYPSGILIVNTCLIGDFIASLPALRLFIKQSTMPVDLMVSPLLKELAQHIRGVRRVYTGKSVQGRAGEALLKTDYPSCDYSRVIVLRLSKNSFRIIKNISTAKIQTYLLKWFGYAANLGGHLIIRTYPKQLRNVIYQMLIERNTALLDDYLRNDVFDDIFEIKTKDILKVKKLLPSHRGKKIVVIHTGASWEMNQWSNLRWVELLKKLGGHIFTFVFIGSTREQRDFDRISKQLDYPVYSLINKMSVNDLMMLLRQSDYFIGIDSGPRNMAHLANLPSVVLLGPGPHTFMPLQNRDIILDKSEGRGLFQRFLFSHRRFIDRITVDEVYESVMHLIKNSYY